jgi:GTPase SAR1 family protein
MDSDKGKIIFPDKNKTSKIKAPLFKIVLVGDSEVGKTTLINTFIVK